MECTVLTKPVISTGELQNQSARVEVKLYSLPDKVHSISVHDKILEIEDMWTSIAPAKTFFSVPFLSLIENHPPKGLKNVYLLVWKAEKIIGVILLQEKNIKLDESLNMQRNVGLEVRLSLMDKIKMAAAKLIRSPLIICGNLLLTGEYGYYFDEKEIKHPESFLLVEESICVFLKSQKSWFRRWTPILMKDFYQEKRFENYKPKTAFTEFYIEPNMIMTLDPAWGDFADYMAAMKSKYRVRVKRAFKKLGDTITKRKLNKEDLLRYQEKMYELYLNIADESGFNIFILPEDYFIQMDNYLGEKAEMCGYFIGEEMIAYVTVVHNEDYMEAHYLGYDKSYNSKHQLYLNMLLDLVEHGIQCKAPKIQFARTALEIKSSIGAVPFEMQCYMKHTAAPLNLLTKTLLDYFVPEKKWEQRSPFK